MTGSLSSQTHRERSVYCVAAVMRCCFAACCCVCCCCFCCFCCELYSCRRGVLFAFVGVLSVCLRVLELEACVCGCIRICCGE
jgi:hypothetical protein